MGIAVNLAGLLDDEKCYGFVRTTRWPAGVSCPTCASSDVARNGHDETQHARQRYLCGGCGSRFDDLTGTILAGHHQSLKIWVLCLWLMGLNLSNRQIALELGLAVGDVQEMTRQLRKGLMERAAAPVLQGEIEIDEVYVIAGHKGNPAAVQKKTAKAGETG